MARVAPSVDAGEDRDAECMPVLPSSVRATDPYRYSDRRAGTKVPLISIILPVYNEEDGLPELLERLSRVCSSFPSEIIFINDGSTDRSLDVLLRLIEDYPNITILELSRNFGHQMAIAAGLDHAAGDAVIMMDADLQHPPELIPKLVCKWQEGYDVVYTCREATEDAGLLKRLTSNFFYSLINRLADVTIPTGAADFRLMDRAAVDAFRSLGERALFLRGIVSWMGFRQVAVPYQAPARFAGKSKYSLLKMVRLAVDGITSFSSIPLYVSIVVGAVVSLLSFLYAGFALYARLVLHQTLEGWTSVMVAVLFLGGVMLISVGVQGIYVGRIYREVKGRPRYLVRRVYQCAENGRVASNTVTSRPGVR